MHPELFSIGNFTVHAYGFMIMLGALIAYLYMASTVKRELGIEPDKIQTVAIFIILSAFIGGKLFFYFEKPNYYFNPPSNMLENFRTGFVFYGSLIFAVPVAVWYFRKEKWPLWAMMDRLAIASLILHASGRLGCFFAGCCYGVPTDLPWGVTFTDELAQAKPLQTTLHPTQLYESFFLLSVLVFLIMFKRYKRFDGQLFMIYLLLYAVGRGIIEIFRGDLRRGFLIEDILSHSQFISILLITVALWMYRRLQKRGKIHKK
ncbi:MAG: prolipoprotein diacylglyceryl transferase [Cytophagales bacterium]|nr:prolipoprotein diacylglyceryl transferase [Cytophagales bacterium]